jgi:hypothetical protein
LFCFKIKNKKDHFISFLTRIYIHQSIFIKCCTLYYSCRLKKNWYPVKWFWLIEIYWPEMRPLKRYLMMLNVPLSHGSEYIPLTRCVTLINIIPLSNKIKSFFLIIFFPNFIQPCTRICRFLVVGNIFRLETCMSSLVKVPPYSKWNFQGEKFSFQTGVILLVTLINIIPLSNKIKSFFLIIFFPNFIHTSNGLQ